MKLFIKQLLRLLTRLTAKPKIGGLQINDSALQYVRIDRELQALSLRLPPGVFQEGRLLELGQLLGALKQLHHMIDPGNEDRAIPVIVSLPPALVYTQSFAVPNVGEKHIDESAYLNLQMLSPVAKDAAYMSSEIIGVGSDKYELLGAFTERAHVDKLRSTLEEAHFAPIALEFPGLSLTRLVGHTLGPKTSATLVCQVSSDGIEFSIVRNGSLYFDYFRSWRSIQGENREIPRALFESVVAEEVQKVVNFTLSRFEENLREVVLVAPGFEKDLQAFLEKRFNLAVEPLELRSWSLSPTWYAPLGAALRGVMERKEDRSISLAPFSPLEILYQEQLLDFVWLWRNIVVGVMAVFLLFFGGTAYLLVNNAYDLTERLSSFRSQPQQTELVNLQAKAEEFNRLLKSVGAAKGLSGPWFPLLSRLDKLADQHEVIVDRVEVEGIDKPVKVVAHTLPSKVKDFQDALYRESGFSEISLPATSLTQLSNGLMSFTIGFRFSVGPRG